MTCIASDVKLYFEAKQCDLILEHNAKITASPFECIQNQSVNPLLIRKFKPSFSKLNTSLQIL